MTGHPGVGEEHGKGGVRAGVEGGRREGGKGRRGEGINGAVGRRWGRRGWRGDVGALCGVRLLLVLAVAALSVDGLRCFFKLEQDNIQTVIDCDKDSATNNSKNCISVIHPSGRSSMGCEVTDVKMQQAGGQINCSAASSGIINISAEIRNYTCCENTVCNQLSSISVQNSFTPGTEVFVRCTDYVPRDHLREGTTIADRQCTRNAFSSIITGPSTCSETQSSRPNSDWSVGQTSDFEKTFFNQDTSPPACYSVAGFVQGGFCGARRQTDKFGDPGMGKAFDGKYQMNLCAGSKTQALSLGNALSVGAEGLSYEGCLDLLTTSSLNNDCTTIRGQFNISKQILPDCCVDYYHTPADVRGQCACGGDGLTEDCIKVCCCDAALNEKSDDDRCELLRDFMWIDFWLEKMVREQCCNTRLMDQCNNNFGCRDTEGEQGRVKGISALPMCCSYCLSFYDKMCSYDMDLEEGAILTISMSSAANFPFLDAYCREQRGCKDDFPCNFVSKAGKVRPAVGPILLLGTLTLVLLSLYSL